MIERLPYAQIERLNRAIALATTAKEATTRRYRNDILTKALTATGGLSYDPKADRFHYHRHLAYQIKRFTPQKGITDSCS
jgi:hypothetical protein